MVAAMTDPILAYVVPTKDRPDDLRKLLASLVVQTRQPRQIIIVDGSDPVIEPVLAEFPGLPLTYVRVFPPSLAKQRNAGMAALRPDITVAGYLDDDLVLEADATERMAAFWRDAGAEVGGAAFCILNQPVASNNKLTGLFLVDSPLPGRLLPSGFQSQIPPLLTTTAVQWLYGGATLWRRTVIDSFSYDEWYIGHGYLEDVDYSHRVARGHKLFVVGEARCYHYSRPIALAREYTLGRQQIVNRAYFVAKLGGFSKAALAWAFFGQALTNLASSLRRRDSAGLRRFAGNMAGLLSLALGDRRQIGNYYK